MSQPSSELVAATADVAVFIVNPDNDGLSVVLVENENGRALPSTQVEAKPGSPQPDIFAVQAVRSILRDPSQKISPAPWQSITAKHGSHVSIGYAAVAPRDAVKLGEDITAASLASLRSDGQTGAPGQIEIIEAGIASLGFKTLGNWPGKEHVTPTPDTPQILETLMPERFTLQALGEVIGEMVGGFSRNNTKLARMAAALGARQTQYTRHPGGNSRPFILWTFATAPEAIG